MNSDRNRENSRLFSHGRLRSVLVALGAFCAFCVLLSPPAFAQKRCRLGRGERHERCRDTGRVGDLNQHGDGRDHDDQDEQ